MIVELKYVWDKARFIRAMKERYDFNFTGLKYRIISGLLIFYLVLGILFVVASQSYVVLTLTGAICAYWFFLAWPLIKLFSMRYFKKYSEKDTLISVVIDENGFTVDSVESKGTFTWKAITEAVETRRGFLLFKYPMYFSIFIEDFKSAEELQWFRQTLKEKVVRFKQQC